jgi:uncharacterized tellurite resistance protein B-like protein
VGEGGSLRQMSREERMLLMRFICSFAWADAQLREEERALVRRYVGKLGLDRDEQAIVRGWLELPPPRDSVDPKLVPARHRLLFIHALESLVAADGEVAPAERARLIELARHLR